MKKIIFFFIFLIILNSSALAVSINEVKSKGIEWIEIWNKDKIMLNLSLWTIQDNSTDNPDTLKCEIENCSLETNVEYFLILGKAVRIENITSEDVVYFYTDDQKIGNGLNDNGDIIIIKENNLTISSISYGIIENSSLSFQLVGEELCEGVPTPGKENKCIEESTEKEIKKEDSINNETTIEKIEKDAEILDEKDDTKNESDNITRIIANQTNTKKTLTTQTIKENMTSENVKIIYQSKNDKIKDATIYLLMGLLILLVIYIIKRKI
ncbi:MAG: hypothetical protein QW041_00410 [Candidatus Pacearchaeota archaeon]